MINVRNLTFDYPRSRALKNLSFTIEEKSITALVGPNGAGKTTLLKCLSGLERPFSGSITVDGIDVQKMPRKCHEIVGFLPDFFGLYDNLTVKQALTYFASVNKVKNQCIPETIEKNLKKLDIENKLNEKIGTLSRGMRQRLAIAQVLIEEPKVLLLDEPASGLDPGSRYSLGKLFKQLKDLGTTLVVSSHILSELEQYADDLMILRNGRLVSHTKSFESDKSEKTSLIIRAISNINNLKSKFESNSLIEKIQIKDEEALVTLNGGPKECNELMKQIINQDIDIYEFCITQKDMQSQYIDIISNKEHDTSHEKQ